MVIALVAAAFALSGPQAPASDVVAYIDTVQQNVDITQPQPLEWGTIQTGMAYTKNFTVANIGTQTYKITLYTTEPPTATLTWEANNTILTGNSYVQSSLILPSAVQGTYTWKVIASNSSIPTPTPAPTPIVDVVYEFTMLPPSEGMAIFNVTINGHPYSFTPSTLPSEGMKFYYEGGDILKFATQPLEGYTLNFWYYNDNPVGGGSNPYTITNASGNFTIKPTYSLTT